MSALATYIYRASIPLNIHHFWLPLLLICIVTPCARGPSRLAMAVRHLWCSHPFLARFAIRWRCDLNLGVQWDYGHELSVDLAAHNGQVDVVCTRQGEVRFEAYWGLKCTAFFQDPRLSRSWASENQHIRTWYRICSYTLSQISQRRLRSKMGSQLLVTPRRWFRYLLRLHRFFGATELQMLLGLSIAVCDNWSRMMTWQEGMRLRAWETAAAICEELRGVGTLIKIQLIAFCRAEWELVMEDKVQEVGEGLGQTHIAALARSVTNG